MAKLILLRKYYGTDWIHCFFLLIEFGVDHINASSSGNLGIWNHVHIWSVYARVLLSFTGLLCIYLRPWAHDQNGNEGAANYARAWHPTLTPRVLLRSLWRKKMSTNVLRNVILYSSKSIKQNPVPISKRNMGGGRHFHYPKWVWSPAGESRKYIYVYMRIDIFERKINSCMWLF